MPNWEIHQLESPESLQGIEELQAMIWPGSQREIVPIHMFLAAIHNGGLVLGAFSKKRMIGMLFGFPGMYPNNGAMQLKHCSHMLGVLPDWRDTGLGYELKCIQRQLLLSQGLNLITWTYDPLQSRNAYLNISKLGAVCNTYRLSEYGQMFDSLNAGLDSDRFQVDWWLNSCRVQKTLEDSRKNEMKLDGFLDGKIEIVSISEDLQPPSGFPDLNQPLLLIEIPNDLLALTTRDILIAQAWRQTSREIFEFVFANGYSVIDFVVDEGRSYYVLEYSETSNMVNGRQCIKKAGSRSKENG
jgi:predicted GNAT superfamily acetyltransferase